MKKILAISLALFTTACSNSHNLMFDYGSETGKEVQKVEPNVGYNALAEAVPKYNRLNQLDFQPITKPGDYEFVITENSPSFKFSTGKSFIKGIALPDSKEKIQISISSAILNSGFLPTILLLDAQYNPLHVYGQETINYNQGSLLHIDRFFGEIEIPAIKDEQVQAKYLIILTTDKAMQSETIIPDADSTAIDLGRADAVYQTYTNAPRPHTATGVVKINFNYNKSADAMLNEQMVIEDNKNVINQQTAQTLIDEKQVIITKDTIQPETEAMFIVLIDKAVKAGDIIKAQRFVDEAKLAGSTKAEEAFKSAVATYQP